MQVVCSIPPGYIARLHGKSKECYQRVEKELAIEEAET